MVEVLQQLKQLNDGKIFLRQLSSEVKNSVLVSLGKALEANRRVVLDANTMDIESFRHSAKFQSALLDRLTLNDKRIDSMIESLKVVSELKDPVGEIIENKKLPNGLDVRRTRSPLGVIFLIFEARPNVITEAFSLAFKAGNSLILKGGKESTHTSRALYHLIEASLKENGVDPFVFWGLLDASRETTDFLMKQNKWIDVLIPRGGDRLIEYVTEHSTIPLIKNDRGLCHIYVHADADTEMALMILDNAKTQRPSVCNAVETLLIHDAIAPRLLPLLKERLGKKGVEFLVCPRALVLMGKSENVHPAPPNAFDTEYLALKLSVKVVKGLAEAMSHIEQHGSRHSESIITSEQEVARQFQIGVDAAAVYWNASTRFTDGGQMGLGAEIGISTQKLHIRGPVGLESLTSIRWIIDGKGHIRSS
ncbi:MAG: hypothetical protein RJB66_2533 [Pseudomonadota bacterium]